MNFYCGQKVPFPEIQAFFFGADFLCFLGLG